MTQYVQEKVEKLEHPITSWALLGVIVSLVCVYALFINATISHIVATKDMQNQISTVTSAVSDLESNYLSAKSSITIDLALADGFKTVKEDPTFISKAPIGALSFNR